MAPAEQVPSRAKRRKKASSTCCFLLLMAVIPCFVLAVFVLTQLAVLGVLLDRIERLARGNLKLCPREFGDLSYHVHVAIW